MASQHAQSSNVINHPCTICCTPTSNWCSRCQSAWYCSPEHLQSDWNRHRKFCVPVTPQPPAQPPAPAVTASFTALIFPADEERARLIRVNCWPAESPSSGPCQWTPLITPHLPGQVASVVLTQGLNSEPLRFPIQVFYLPEALSKGTPINRSILRLTAGQAPRKWAGTVVALKYSGSRRQGYMDATTNDLTALVSYFLSFQ